MPKQTANYRDRLKLLVEGKYVEIELRSEQMKKKEGKKLVAIDQAATRRGKVEAVKRCVDQ